METAFITAWVILTLVFTVGAVIDTLFVKGTK